MRHKNELFVGVAIVVGLTIFILGGRYFQNLPLFRGTYDLETSFENAGGLIKGNTVRINGYSAGSVTHVWIDTENNRIRATFRVNEGIEIPNDSYTQVTGIEALGVVYLTIRMGSPNAPKLQEGDFIPSRMEADLMTSLTDKAPVLMGRVDSVLLNLDATLGDARGLMGSSGEDLALTLRSLRSTTSTLNTLLRTEQARVAQVLDNVGQLTGNLSGLTETYGDTLGATVQNLNAVLSRLDQSLTGLDATTAGLDTLLTKINQGEGTLGRLVNDDALYHKLDSTLTHVDALILDLKAHPRRYLRHLRLVDLF